MEPQNMRSWEEEREESRLLEVDFDLPSPQVLMNLLCSPIAPSPPLNFCEESNPNPNGSDEEDNEEEIMAYHNLKPPTPVWNFTKMGNLDVLYNVHYRITERMTTALKYFKESTEQHQILAQVWAPVRSGNRSVLTTTGQPFVLGPHSNGLNQYRTISLMYMFSVDDVGDTDGSLGLPGRVFKSKMPEWTPNVQFYSRKEYPQINHAKYYNVRGTVALPVFEPSGQSCVGVLELIMTSQKINYAAEVDIVCKALEAVNLRSSEILDRPAIQICNEGRQNALAEILELLTGVCETFNLPLAQTWVPCMHQTVLAYGAGFKNSCSSFDGSCTGQVCMSTTDVAFYVVDAHMWGFREACAEHHLQKGQGVSGVAFLTRGLCFCRDISQFCELDYPLVHYARMFGLTASFAICLRSKYSGDDDYVVEFFLPPNLTNIPEQLLDYMMAMMKGGLHNHLMVASGKTLEEERKQLTIIEVSLDGNPTLQVKSKFSTEFCPVTDSVNSVPLLIENSRPKLMAETAVGKTILGEGCVQTAVSAVGNKETKKTSESKPGKAAKQISLEVLQQHFTGSLKEAAKSLGVSKSTLKRRCRENGIDRWPTIRKRKSRDPPIQLKCSSSSASGSKLIGPLTNPADCECIAECLDASHQCMSVNHAPSVYCEMNQSPVNMKLATVREATKKTQNEEFPDEILAQCKSGVRPDGNSATFIVKATYKEDIIRLELSKFSIVELKAEVGKRLNLETNKFKIKYQDDDNDWVLMASDSDLLHSFSVSRSFASSTLRLLIQDIL